jgi:hypothetical protein
LRIDITQNSTELSGYPQTFGVTATSPGCTSSTSGITCTETLTLQPGSYVAGVTAEDTSGNALSVQQNIAFTITANQNSTISLSLSGVPHAIRITAVAPQLTGGDQTAGFSLIGLGAHQFTAQALDADGNVIVGPGSPVFTVRASNSLPAVLSTPAPAAAYTFALTPPALFTSTTAQITVQASFPTGTDGCAQSGAVCSANATVAMQELVAVTGSAGTKLYANGSTTALATVGAGSAPMPIAYDKEGDIFVGFYNSNAVAMFAPPYTGSPTLITSGVTAPLAIAVDRYDNLFVADNLAITEYAPPYTATPVATIQSGISPVGLGLPEDIKFDSNGNLFAAYPGAIEVGIFTPPYTGTPTMVSAGLNSPYGVALDQSNDLFIANFVGSNAVEYAPPYTQATPTNTLSNLGIANPTTLAVNASGTVFVPSAFSKILAFSPPYTGTPLAITNGVTTGSNGYAPTGLAVDASGDLFVATASTLLRFAPPYTGTPLQATPGGSLQSIAILP